VVAWLSVVARSVSGMGQVLAAEQGGSPLGADRVGELLSQVMGLLAEAGQVRGWSASDEQVLANVRLGHQAVAVVEGLRLGLVRQLQSRPEAVPGASGGKAAATFLVQALRVSPVQAGRDVATAVAIDPQVGELPLLGAALAAGEISREHADVAVAAVAKLPASAKRQVDDQGRSGLQRLDVFLLRYCRTHAPATIGLLGRELLQLVDPDRATRLDGDSYARRGLSYSVDAFGMTQGRFTLDPVAGAQVISALQAHAVPRPAGTAVDQDGQPVEVPDQRTRRQRLADGLLEIAEKACGSSDPATTSTAARIIVSATVDQVAAAGGADDPAARGAGLARMTVGGYFGGVGSTVDPATLARLACDGVLQRVLLAPSGAVLDLGVRVRLASAAQRKALIARDGGCVMVGCGMPPERCDVHHVRAWAQGGPTDLDNLVLLCGREHTAVHAGVVQIVMRDGVPWIRPELVKFPV